MTSSADPTPRLLLYTDIKDSDTPVMETISQCNGFSDIGMRLCADLPMPQPSRLPESMFSTIIPEFRRDHFMEVIAGLALTQVPIHRVCATN
jgi:hypothetical protein